ncbi:MFS transporter [Kiloniella sp. b19]|uniref:MFS transporter n=1 Tax=Kiloniella sp. GXU_MW_B19 TaxID=3141326 RepID=UPI0031DB7476
MTTTSISQPHSSPYASLAAIISGVVLLQAGMSLMSALLPLRMAEAGFSSAEIGYMTAAFAGGFLLGCLYAPRLIAKVGHIRAFACFATVLSVLTLALAIDTSIGLWSIARLMSGICFAGMLTVSDSWITVEADSSRRGRVLAVYTLCYKVAQGLGPLALTLATIFGNWHFMLVSALISMSLLPVAMRKGGNPKAQSTNPDNARQDRMSIRQVFDRSPLAFIACLFVGIMNSPLANLLSLYGASIGFSTEQAVLLVAGFQFGAVLFQIPMGIASDRGDRRTVLVFAVSCVAAISLLFILMETMLGLWAQIGLIFVMGGVTMSVYPIALSHAGDYCKENEMVPLCATLMLAYGVGMTLGPITATKLMHFVGPGGLFLHTVILAVTFIAIALYRMSRRTSLPREERNEYIPVPPSSPVISRLDPRSDVTRSVRDADDVY